MSPRTVSRLFEEAGDCGHSTNHSLRATAATCMFDVGIDEQVIMHCTGHSSAVGVRSYKRTTDSLKKTSEVMPVFTKKEKLDSEPCEASAVVENKENKPMGAPKSHSINCAGASNFTVYFNY